jgi:rfaE bifunctional protein kinase chain/domain
MKRIVNRKRALEIIEAFSRSKVLVIGDIMVDQFIWGKVSRISPEAPVPVVRVTSENLLLGGCSNVLNNVYSIGGKASVSGIIGSDEMGKWLLGELRKMDIDTGGIVVEKNRPTSVKTRIIAHSQQVVRFDREDKTPIQSSSIKKIINHIDSVKDDLGAIVVSDYNKGVVFKRLIEGIKNVISERDIILCVDPKQNDFSLYDGCDLITPNQYEAERALGIEFNSDEDIIEGGKELINRFGFKAALITRGEEGMVLFEKNGDVVPIPAVAKEVFDVTGAGDTVIGIFALCVAAGATFKEAAALANHAAGVVVGKVGTAKVSQEELKKVL